LAADTVAAEAASPASRLEVLDSAEIPAQGMNGHKIEELSGLAWDADEQLLYAVSDTGVLHHFRVRLDGDRIAQVDVVYSAPLTAEDGTELTVNDAEDVAVVSGDNGKNSDSELLVALEDGPAIARFTPHGRRIANLALPTALADEAHYAKKNRRLESVAFDPQHGVVTAPETPLLDQPEDLHTLYAADGAERSFEAFPSKDSNLKAIAMMPDDNALILERTREAKGAPFVARLRLVDLADCAENATCRVTELSSGDEAALTDNFEGMARLSDDLLLLVTDKTVKDGEPTSFTLVALEPPTQ
jgi:hypothetical protein